VKLKTIRNREFREYGQIVDGYNWSDFLTVLKRETPNPVDKIIYVASEPKLEKLPVFHDLQNAYYGGLPIQIGYCNGHSTKLNGLEYHRDSEINITAGDVILMLAKQSDIDIKDWSISSSKVNAFFVPGGTAVELFATTLHYSPSSIDKNGYQVAVILPRGTNEKKPDIKVKNGEDRLLFAMNKWLIVHQDAENEISNGAYIGIKGKNPDVSVLWKH
jgi:hypothetical protein